MKTRSLRIAVADDEADMRDYFRHILTSLGHQVTVTAATGRELAAACKASRPDLVISDIKMPDLDGLEAAEEICRDGPLPLILVSAFHDADLLARAAEIHVLAYLVKPIEQPDLEAAMAIAMRRFEEFQALGREAAHLRQALEDRKIIERAKGLLMKRANLDEPEAFRRLQRLAKDKNRKLVDIAQAIIVADEAMGPQESR